MRIPDNRDARQPFFDADPAGGLGNRRNQVRGPSAGSGMSIATGMSFHVRSRLMGTGRGDFFVSDPLLQTAIAPEIHPRTTAGGPIVK